MSFAHYTDNPAILSQSRTGLTRQRTHVQWVRLAVCLNKRHLQKFLSLENRQAACFYRFSGHDGLILSRNKYLRWHYQSVKEVGAFDEAPYKAVWESSGGDGAKAAETIGLQGVPASYDEYIALVKSGKFKD